jgi:hypothetical protein
MYYYRGKLQYMINRQRSRPHEAVFAAIAKGTRVKNGIVWALVLLSSASVHCIAQGVIEIDLPAKDIALNSQTGMLYATVPSSAGVPYGNRLVEISPIDGSISRSVFIGSEPFCIGMSPDAAVAYVGLSGAALVYPVDLATMTKGTSFSMGNTPSDGSRYANQIEVMAASPGTVAISMRNHGFSPNFAGVAIFDNGVARPNADHSFTGGNTIAFGAQPNTLYGYTNETSDFTLERLSVDASGVSIADSAGNAIYGYNTKIISRGDTIYATSGALVDGTQLLRIGTYTLPGSGFGHAVAVDDATSSAVFAQFSQILTYDRDTFVPVKTLNLPTFGTPVAATNCGRAACVAVAYDSGQIFIVSDVRDIFKDGFEY